MTVPEGKLVIKGRWPRKLGTGPELGAQRLMGTGSVCTRSPQASGAAGPRAASNGWTGVTAEQAQHRQRRPELMTGGETGSANRLNKKRGAGQCLSQPRMLALSVQWGRLHSTL